MNILVTGGAGFIGSNVVDALLRDGHRVVILDNLSRPNVVKNLMWLVGNHKRLKFLQHDIRDAQKLIHTVEDLSIDIVFHFAAQTAVTTSIINPREDFEVNALGTLNVLEAIRLSEKKPYLILASTNKVYGEFVTNKPIDETQPLSFSTPYGCSKGAADQYVQDYGKIYGLKTCVFRMSCIYGNRQWGTEDQGWLAHFLFAREKKQDITIYGDGSQVRDVLAIEDFVMLCKMLLRDKTVGVFNIGGGEKNAISVSGAANTMKVVYSFGPWRSSDQRYYVSDIVKIERVLGWQPRVLFKMEGLTKLLTWVKSQSS